MSKLPLPTPASRFRWKSLSDNDELQAQGTVWAGDRHDWEHILTAWRETREGRDVFDVSVWKKEEGHPGRFVRMGENIATHEEAVNYAIALVQLGEVDFEFLEP